MLNEAGYTKLIDFGVAGDTDLTSAREVALNALNDLPFVIDTPAANAWVQGLGDSTITLRCAGWVNQRDTSLQLAKGQAIEAVKLALESAGVEMPEPTYRLATQGAIETKSVKKKKKPKKEAVVLEDVKADEALDHIIEEEREELSNEDLLTEAAPEE